MIQSYPAANGTVARHWPFYKRLGFDIAGVGTLGGGCVWPEPVTERQIGGNSYINGPHLPRRLVETFDWYLKEPLFEKYTHAMVCEYDCLFFRTPPSDWVIYASAHKHASNWGDDRFKSTGCWHSPWWLCREAAQQFVRIGRELLLGNDIEGGSPDWFFGLVWDRIGHEPIHLNGSLSGNTLGLPNQISVAQVRDAVRADTIWAVHGVKSAAMLAEVLS